MSDRRVSDVLQVDPKDRNVAKSGTQMCEVLEVVRLIGQPVTADMIAPGPRLSKDTVGRYLRRLADDGFITKVSRGRYTIRATAEQDGQVPEK